VIRHGSGEPIIIRNLQRTHYLETDPFVLNYNLGTYVGIDVKWNKTAVGALCVVYQTEVEPRAEDLHLMRIIGTAIGVEEERKRAEGALRDALSEVEKLKNRLQEENIYLKEEIRSEYNFEEIIGKSEALQRVFHRVEQVAPTDATALIEGESGTGKELIARAIHNLSLRKDRALVKVNCGAISAGLVESELFGHEKGAFTGAVQRRVGRFELADGGTIFLDEVGELPPETQIKLLRP
jgi:formate hydrogenlyase transcriptional activator